jgi:hypothetical protein
MYQCRLVKAFGFDFAQPDRYPEQPALSEAEGKSKGGTIRPK